MQHFGKVLSLVSFAVSFAACTNTTSTDSRQTAPVRFGATLEKSASAAAPAFAPAARRLTFGDDITITSVKVVLSGIDLQDAGMMPGDVTGPGMMTSKRRTGDMDMDGRRTDSLLRKPEEIDFMGPFVWDLTNRTVTPSLEAVSVPTGVYHRLDLAFDPFTEDEAESMGYPVTDTVVGHSYVIEGYLNHVTYGTVTDGTVKLLVFGDQSRTFHVPLRAGLPVTAGTVNDILLVFGADGWFPSSLVGQLRSGLNTGDVTVDASGLEPVVILDANRNASVAAQFHKLFHGSMRVAKDADGDQTLDPEEPAEPVPSGE